MAHASDGGNRENGGAVSGLFKAPACHVAHQLAQRPDFCETALDILRLQAEGLSVNKIAQELGMKAETVRYHTKENYRKLGVAGKTDAVLAARDLGIL